MRILFVLFITVPIVEVWLLISVGGFIGPWLTIGLVFLTAFVGLALLRHQGAAALRAARDKLDTRQLPLQEMAATFFFAIGGVFLLTPGFITDIIGLMCLIPGLRAWLILSLGHHLFKSGHVYTQSPKAANDEGNRQVTGYIIDGEVENHKDRD